MKDPSRVILMGDPSEFRIKEGANPHTRNRWGFKKKVDSAKAQEQWNVMAETLSRYGIQIFVIPAHPDYPGLVFPANAGYVPEKDKAKSLSERLFIAANLNPARAGEGEIYQEFISKMGVTVTRIHGAFEGEADLISWGENYLFTHGQLRRPQWRPRLGIPPWQRQYGFRSEHHAIHELAHWVPPDHVMAVQLLDELYYHGDTVFCSFGPERRYLLAYEKGIAPLARRVLHESNAVIWLSDEDAARFAANSFGVQHDDQSILFMPSVISDQLKREIESLHVEIVTIDVSEFFEKGGGSIKCMIGDLGTWAPDSNISPDVQAFRHDHLFNND